MSTSRRDLLRLRLGLGLGTQLSSLLGTRAGTAIQQHSRSGPEQLPGSSAERGYHESAPPWLQPAETDVTQTD